MNTCAQLVELLALSHAGGDFCRLLITFANSLDPDQDRQNVGPDMKPKPLDTLIVFMTASLKKVIFLKKKSADDKKHSKLPSMQRVYDHVGIIRITYLPITLATSRILHEAFHKGPIRKLFILTLKAPITNAAEDKLYDIFPNFRTK